MKRFVAVAGNIGVGKSSLTGLLADELGWTPFFEAVDDNPYLADFYVDMERWAFHSQIFFLARRLQNYRAILDHPEPSVQDRTVYEDAEVFARNLYRQGYIDERDWRSYCELYEGVLAVLPPPDLLVYLRASVSTLTQRIARRGREFEHSISSEYLAQLNGLYEQWVSSFTLCPVVVVDADTVDFVGEEAHLNRIIERILEQLPAPPRARNERIG